LHALPYYNRAYYAVAVLTLKFLDTHKDERAGGGLHCLTNV